MTGPAGTDATTASDLRAFDELIRTAFGEATVVVRSTDYEIDLELPVTAEQVQELWRGNGTATTPSADSGEEGWWAAPGVHEAVSDLAPAQPSAAVRAAQQAAADLLRQATSDRPADVSALFALSDQFRGLALAGLAEMDATGSHLTTGAATAATWLRDDRVLSDVAARADVRLGTALRDELPELGRLLREGGTTVEHARAAVAGTRGLDKRVVQDSDTAICALVASADPPTVRAYLRERAESVNPELGRDVERRAHARRGLTVDSVGTSGGVLGGALGVEDTEIVLLGLDLAVQSDRTDGDDRSLRQRRADVLVQWARQAAAEHGGQAVREDLRSTRTQLLLTCTADQLAAAARIARLGGHDWPRDPAFTLPSLLEAVTGSSAAEAGEPAPGSRVPAGASFGPGLLVGLEALRRLLCDASISLVVTAEPDGETTADLGANPLGIRPGRRLADPLYVGRAARIVTAAQWRALVVRDRHCVVKGCRRRPLRCEAHHVRHWLDGGATDLDNLVLLCFQHHHEHHDRGRDLQHRDGRWITSTGWGAQAPP